MISSLRNHWECLKSVQEGKKRHDRSSCGEVPSGPWEGSIKKLEQSSSIGLQLMTEIRSRQNRIWWTQIILWSCTKRCTIKSLIWENHKFPALQAKCSTKARWDDLRRRNDFGFEIGCQSFPVNYNKMERKLSRVYYSPKGFLKGLPAVKKLAKEAGVSKDVAKLWLMKQAIWQIYLLAPKHIPRPTF